MTTSTTTKSTPVLLISKEKMQKKLSALKRLSSSCYVSTYISKGGAHAIKRHRPDDLQTLYTYVFSYGTYHVLLDGSKSRPKGYTECYDYASA